MNLNLVGREVSRVMCHNGVHCGMNINSRVSKCVMHDEHLAYAGAGGTKAKMTMTPLGVLMEFADGAEKLVPLSNIYEIDFQVETKLAAVKK